MSTTHPDRRRSRASLVLTLALSLLAGGLAACSGDDVPAPSGDATHRHRHGGRQLGPPHFRVPDDVAGDLEALLARRAQALIGHDRTAFDAGLAGDPGFRSAQDSYYANLAQLPLSVLRYRLDPASLVRAGESYWVDVDVVMRLEGYDAHPVVSPDRYRFVPRGQGFALASVSDPAWERRHHVRSQPWDDQSLVVRRGHGVLGLFDPGSASRAGAVMAAVTRGVSQVRAEVPLEWDGSVVVYALSDPSFLERLPHVPGGDALAVDALTFPVFARPGSHRIASMRFVLNPRLLGEAGTARDRLIRHELTHVAMGRLDGRIPVWLSEGLAEYVSVQPIPPEDRVISGAALRAARRGFTRLPDDATFNGPGAEAHYGEAWWACEAIAEGYGEHMLWSLADDLAGAPDPDAELKVLLGISARRLARRAGAMMLATYDPGGPQERQGRKDSKGSR